MKKIIEPDYEYVILVDEKNNEIGTEKKSEIHKTKTPLHRAFSCFIFNKKNELLLQQRAICKKTWPLVWSNSICGHPKLFESNIFAVKRRAKDELGCEVENVLEISPYRYRASRNGVEENEICPILVARLSSEINLNKNEVEDIRWISWNDWLEEIKNDKSDKYSIWCKEETEILNKDDNFKKFMKFHQHL